MHFLTFFAHICQGIFSKSEKKIDIFSDDSKKSIFSLNFKAATRKLFNPQF